MVQDNATNADGAPVVKPSVAAPNKPTKTTTYTRSQFANMTPEEINEAYETGDLAAALKEGRVKNE